MNSRLALILASISMLGCNDLPGEATVEIQPASPVTGDELRVVFLADALDPNDDELTYAYRWQVDGSDVPDITGSTVPAELTAKGQTWSVSVVASDGKGDGPAAGASVVIGNTPPSATSASITPSSPSKLDTLSCAGGGFADADEDPESFDIQWVINGMPSSATGDLVGTEFSRGDSIACVVFPNDGTEQGSPVTSAAVSVVNAPPSVSGVGFDPAAPGVSEVVSVITDPPVDVDGDAVTLSYAWTVDGAAAGTGTSIDLGNYARGQTVEVTVTPNDGTEDGPAVVGTLIIGNAPPAPPTVTINPLFPDRSSAITCEITNPAVDPDGDTVTYTFSWTVDGAAWSGTPTDTNLPGDTIPADVLNDYEAWQCAAVASDGTLDSAAATQAVKVRAPAVDINGLSAGDLSGASVASAGDVDGDGLTDFLVGAYREDSLGERTGAAYLFLGASLTAGDSLDMGDADYVFPGPNARDEFGRAVAGIGDIDSDGLADFAIGAPYGDGDDTNSGVVYVFKGSSLGVEKRIDASTADYIIVGDTREERVGSTLSAAGDVDGDGTPDLLVGAQLSARQAVDQGAVYVFLGSVLGSEQEVALSDAEVVFQGEKLGARAGSSLAAAGDIDGDGNGDFLIGSFRESSGGTDAGAAYVILGGSWSLPVVSLSTAAYRLVGPRLSRSGTSVGSGDIDGDGTPDVLVGGPGNLYGTSITVGSTYVIYGTSFGATQTLSLEADSDVIIRGESVGDLAGWVSASGADADGDGLDDIVVCAPGASVGGIDDSGKAYLVPGASLTSATEYDLGSGVFSSGGESGASFGLSCDLLPDFDGEGLADIVVGAPLDSVNAERAGSVSVVPTPYPN